MFARGELDIFLATLEIRYMLILFAFDMDTSTSRPRRAYRVAKQHIEPKAISSDTKWHISMLKLLFVETNNSFNVPCSWKHIYRCNATDCISQFLKYSAVACEGIGVAGNVDNSIHFAL